MMNVLALDAASPRPAVAFWSNGRVFEERLPGDRRASEDLLPAVRRALAAAAVAIGACDRIAVCAGPGSFTGLRVGLATAWGLGRGLGIPVEPVSTLEAMAETARPHGPAPVVAVLEAGRGELVCERFMLDVDRARSLGPAALLLAQDVARFAAGERLVALTPEVAAGENDPPVFSVAAALAAAVARHPRLASISPGGIYSRPSAAEEKRGAP